MEDNNGGENSPNSLSLCTLSLQLAIIVPQINLIGYNTATAQSALCTFNITAKRPSSPLLNPRSSRSRYKWFNYTINLKKVTSQWILPGKNSEAFSERMWINSPSCWKIWAPPQKQNIFCYINSQAVQLHNWDSQSLNHLSSTAPRLCSYIGGHAIPSNFTVLWAQ